MGQLLAPLADDDDDDDTEKEMGLAHRCNLSKFADKLQFARTSPLGNIGAKKHSTSSSFGRNCREAYLQHLESTRAKRRSKFTFSNSVNSGAEDDSLSNMSDSMISQSSMISNSSEFGRQISAHISGEGDPTRLKFMRKLSYEKVWLPKPLRPPSHQTLIIFDWDDTLLCTSYLRRFATCGVQDLAEPTQCTLKAIEDHAVKLLEMALNCGQAFIITNAIAGWVEASAKFWAPSLAKVLQKVQVLSARSRYEAEFPDDVMRWKAQTFLEIQRRLDTQVITNIISLGDSEYEMEATHIMGETFQQAAMKLVKFTPQPSPGDLLQQLVLVGQAFTEIVEKGRNLSITLKRQ